MTGKLNLVSNNQTTGMIKENYAQVRIWPNFAPVQGNLNRPVRFRNDKTQ